MKKPHRAKDQTLNLRVSADFKEKLAESAKRDRRSITNYLEVTLQDFWAREERASTQAAKRKRK
jgi:predicted HicB family RNase H-like nuclease